MLADPARLAALTASGVFGSAPEERFDRITRLVVSLLGVPAALITLADAERLWFKSRHDTDDAEAPFGEDPEHATFCATVVGTGRTLVVEDARADALFACRAGTSAPSNVRFYAGVPLRTPDGHTLGTLCAYDANPRTLTEHEQALLEDLAAIVVDELELSRRAAQSERLLAAERAARAATERAETQTADLTALLDGFISQSPFGVALIDRAGRYVRVNAELARINGRAVPDFEGRTTAELLDRPGCEALLAYHARALAGETITGVEYNVRLASGAPRWLRASYFPVSTGGEVAGFCALIEDVTASRRSVEERDAFFELSVDLLCIGEPDGRFRRLSPSWEAALGYTRAELVALPAFALVHPDDLNDTRDVPGCVGAAGDVTRFENRLRAKNGDYRWFSWTTVASPEDGTLFRVARDVTEERRVARELHQREEAFRTLADHSPDIVARYDADLRLLYVSPSIEAASGFSRGALVGRRTSDLPLPEGQAERWEALLRAVFTLGRPADHAFAYETAAGTRSYEARLVPEHDAHGAVVSVISVTRDVTERAVATAALAASELQLRTVLDTVADGIVTAEADGTIVSANRAAERLAGYPAPGLVGRDVRDLLPGEDIGARARLQPAGEEQGRPQPHETLLQRADGALVPVELSVGAMRVEGRPMLTGVVRDVTARKAAEAALHVSGARYRALSELFASYAFACRVDEQGGLTLEWVTETVSEVLGFTADEMLAQSPGSLTHPDDVSIWAARNAGVLAGEERADEFRMRTKAGDYRWVRVFTFPERDTLTGRVVRIYGASQDVTTQKASESELVLAKESAEEVVRLKDAFLANMSHEIRTPLTGIIGFSEILADEVTGEHHEIAEHIRAAGQRLMETLTSVLDLARLEAGIVQPCPERIDLPALAADTVRVHGPHAARKGVGFRVENALADARADVDRGLVGGILSNLVGNAIKFTAAGEVVIELGEGAFGDEGAVTLRVRDTGVGISAGFLPHVFDGFRQESAGLARSHEGVGIGLAVTKRMVDLVGGTIVVESARGEGDGGATGTTVTVTIPQPGRPRPISPRAISPRAAGAGGRRRALVVEDQAITRRLVRYHLGDAYDVTEAASHREAIVACAAAAPFDVVLMDINLGAGDPGTRTLGVLRALPACLSAPVVALTAYALPGDRERFLAAGFDGYVAKPFTRETLLDALTPFVPSGDGGPGA